ncbi:DUF2164 family protein [Patescibacteria group bacterium]|nr:DUF2164 family protein [Patescibacteria group bacterium]
MLRKWDIADKEKTKQCIDEIIARIEEQSDAMFGDIAAQDIIDIVGRYLGTEVHNRALDEAKKTIQTKLADLEINIDVLRSSS